ncbi:MAG TPA: FHA domain-containing protein, partial [Myxococcaceae bacterium]|nr:FHA domain-containing protein [Myxococcaceae bacterium]
PMPILVVRNPDGKEREVTLSGDMSIGRAEGCDLVLAEGGVSRQHAKMTVKGEAVVIEDIGSANGTYIEGQRIGSPTVVPPGKVVQVGDYELRVKAGGGPSLAIIKRPRTGAGARVALGDGPAPSTRALPKRVGSGAPVPEQRAPRAPGPRPVRPAAGPRVVRDEAPEGPALVGTSGLWKNKRWLIAGKIVVGRLPGVDVQLDDDSVSRRHAELELTPRGVRLKDLNSANGTAVNGMPVEGTITLQHGDVIQFGVVELTYEYEAEDSLGGGGEGRPRRARLVVVAALTVMILAGAAAAKLLTKPTGPNAQAGPPSLITTLKELLGLSPKQPIIRPVDNGAAIQELLATCRSYISPEHGEPDWAKAEGACQKVLAVEPIQDEATALLKKIKAEQEAKAHFEKADNLTLRLHEEEALTEYGAIPKESYYYTKVKPKIPDALNKALKKTWDDCQIYFKQRDYKSALPRCEGWLKLACQEMEKEDVTPPPGFTVKTALSKKGKLGEREWMSPNLNVQKVYEVRERVDPTAGPFKCEKMDILGFGPKDEKPEKVVARLVAKKYPDRTFAAIVMDYWWGKNEAAVQQLQKIRQDLRRTEMHAQAEDLMLDMNAVASLYKTGQTFIQGGEVDKAADRFREALATDKKLMGDGVQDYPSSWREAILHDISEATLQAGRNYLGTRNDRRTACKYWRMGFEFTKGNVELNRAVGLQCSIEAGHLLTVARSCLDLDGVMALAIEGDDIRQKVEEKRKEWGCQASATAP